MLTQVADAFREAITDTDRDRALKVIRDAVDKGALPEDVVFNVIVPVLESMVRTVGQDLGTNLAQHFMTSQIASEATEEMVARFRQPPTAVGDVVIGTAQGDFHGLGKKIVIGCLKAMTIGVTDLGLSVPPERFVDEAVAHGAQVIGISAMMVHTARGENGCLKVRRILKERGLEGDIKVIVGGAPYRFDHGLYKIVGADTWAEDGVKAGAVITDLIKEVRR